MGMHFIVYVVNAELLYAGQSSVEETDNLI